MVVFVITPVIGQETLAVASSPTAPESGCHSEMMQLKLYFGDVALGVCVGQTVTATDVPMSEAPIGLIVASTADAA